MKINPYLTISRTGSVKATKNKPGIGWDEITLQLDIDIPNSLFQRPTLSASIKVDETSVRSSAITLDEIIIKDIEKSIFEKAGIEVVLKVEDPLLALCKDSAPQA